MKIVKMRGRYKILAISEVGRLHIHQNIPNQDAFNYKVYDKLIVGAVSDGMGSKKFSQIGSRILTSIVVKEAKTFYKNKVLFEKRLLKLYKQKIKPLKIEDTLSTLLFVIIKNNKTYIAKVGDGMVVGVGKENIIIDDDKGFSNLTTTFSVDRLKWWEFDFEFDTIFLATDGISDDIKDKLNFVKNFSEYFFKYPNRKQQLKHMLLNWPVKGSNDDKTLLCIKRVK